MYLQSIELTGFKSFAKKAKLEFKTPITAIVGPNGSGKSNAAEAFRFVLGEQSMKSMRGKKTEDLIFNGSGKLGKSNRASVRLVFDNKKKIFDIDFDQVTIERVIHRDSSSEYLLNGSAVRLKDISELLASANIGMTGHHMISQGETDRILNVNPKERKSMIEDALGLKALQYKKQEGERKLEKTFANMKEAESLRREIRPHLKFLERQVEKIKKAQEMRDELLGRYKEYFKRESEYLSRSRRVLDKERGPLEAQTLQTRDALDEAKTRAEEFAEKVGAESGIKQVEEELGAIRGEKNNLIREVGVIEGQVRALESVQGNHDDVAFEVVEKVVKEAHGEIDAALASQDIGAVHGMLSSIKDRLQTLLGNTARSSEVDTGELTELQGKQSELSTTLQEVEERECTKEKELQELTEKTQAEHVTLREAEQQVFALTGELNKLERDVERLQHREERLSRDQKAFDEERQEAEVLVGQSAVQYDDFQIPGDPSKEERHAQEARRKKIERLKIKLEDSGGASGEEVMSEYKEVEERDKFLERELEDLKGSAESLQGLIDELNEEIGTMFRAGVDKINTEFQELFVAMFGGGTASIAVVEERKSTGDDEDDFEVEEGVDIKVNLPRKKIRGLHMLSGGERALTSIALLFAMSQVNPPPFLILDETDAALDEANSKRYGDMVERLAEHSQLILITHNRETMSRAGVLFGVTMGSDDASQLLSVSFDEAVKVAK